MAIEPRRRRPAWLLAALAGSLLAGSAPGLGSGSATPQECSTASAGLERLLKSSFEVERTFRMTVNGDLKRREVAFLSYSEGELETEVLELDVRSRSMVFDGAGKDFALDFDFACERLRVTQDAEYEVTSEDGLEVARFRLDDDEGALVPTSWRLDTTERFLFKKFVIEGRAQYSEFSWTTPLDG